jgi:hypothetical protein
MEFKLCEYSKHKGTETGVEDSLRSSGIYG